MSSLYRYTEECVWHTGFNTRFTTEELPLLRRANLTQGTIRQDVRIGHGDYTATSVVNSSAPPTTAALNAIAIT